MMWMILTERLMIEVYWILQYLNKDNIVIKYNLRVEHFLRSGWCQKVQNLGFSQTSSDELFPGHLPIPVSVHYPEDCTRTLRWIQMRSVRVGGVHHLKDRLDQLLHLRQLYSSVPVHVIHTEINIWLYFSEQQSCNVNKSRGWLEIIGTEMIY